MAIRTRLCVRLLTLLFQLSTLIAGCLLLTSPAAASNLVITNLSSDSIQAFNARTGVSAGTFAPTGTGGMDSPEGVTFGPDGMLYVASANTNNVLRFNGVTGAFDGVFVAAGSGDLPTFTQ
jgi:outer membrane protein assembly factor BamB